MKHRKDRIWDIRVAFQFRYSPRAVCLLVATCGSGGFRWLNGMRSRTTGCRSIIPVKSADTSVFIPLEDIVRQSADAVSIFTHPGPEESRSAVLEHCTEQGNRSSGSADICRK
jgi:hypothetical protein